MRQLALPTLLLAAAMALAGCGGGAGDEEEIVETIEVAFTKTDPENCTELETQAFVEQLMRTPHESAVESCEQNARAIEHDNDPVAVKNIRVEGPKATADVGLRDDVNQTLTVALVEEDGDWKLDEIVRVSRIDRKEFLENVEKGLETGDSLPGAEAADCVLGTFAKMSDLEIEAMLYRGSAKREIEIYERCGALAGQ